MRKKKHKYQQGQVVKILVSPDILKKHHGKYGIILSLVPSGYYDTSIVEPEYRVMIQGEPHDVYIIYQKEMIQIQ
jgi:hypothetical protein